MSSLGDDFLTMSQAAEFLTTTRPTLYRWLREGKLSAVKMGRQWRFKREDLESFLQGRVAQIDLPADISPFLDALERQIPKPTPRTGELLQDAFSRMVEMALARQADTLHLSTCFLADKPKPESWLRCRVDGILQLCAPIDTRLVPPLIEYWKRQACCDTRESNLPQDGRIVVESEQPGGERRLLDLRVSFLPTAMGEMLTIRLLDRRLNHQDLNHFELLPRERTGLKKALQQRSRLLIISGCADSARMSLLAACLGEVSGPHTKVVTIESPMWQAIPWATQISLQYFGQKRSHAVAVKTVMRSDPDVVGLGKISDPEAMAAVQEAVLNGALVVATLESDGCLATLRRLVELSGSPHAISQLLVFLISQRLIRKLCAECSTPERIDDLDFEELKREAHKGGVAQEDLKRDFRRAQGCQSCGGVGYRGRQILAESLHLSREMIELLAKASSDESLIQEAVKGGMVSLDAQAIRLACEGVTSLDEVARLSGASIPR